MSPLHSPSGRQRKAVSRINCEKAHEREGIGRRRKRSERIALASAGCERDRARPLCDGRSRLPALYQPRLHRDLRLPAGGGAGPFAPWSCSGRTATTRASSSGSPFRSAGAGPSTRRSGPSTRAEGALAAGHVRPVRGADGRVENLVCVLENTTDSRQIQKLQRDVLEAVAQDLPLRRGRCDLICRRVEAIFPEVVSIHHCGGPRQAAAAARQPVAARFLCPGDRRRVDRPRRGVVRDVRLSRRTGDLRRHRDRPALG